MAVRALSLLGDLTETQMRPPSSPILVVQERSKTIRFSSLVEREELGPS